MHTCSKKDNDLFEPNPNKPLILKEELVSVLVRPEIADLAKLISDNFWSNDTIPDREFGMTQYSLSVSVYQNLLKKLEDDETENKTCLDIEYE